MNKEIEDLQSNVQTITDLADRRRKEFGDSGYGNPTSSAPKRNYRCGRSSSLPLIPPLGAPCPENSWKTSSYVKDEEEGQKILESLGSYYKKARISKKGGSESGGGLSRSVQTGP